MFRFSSPRLACLCVSVSSVLSGLVMGCSTTTVDDTTSPAGPPGLTLAVLSCNQPVTVATGAVSPAVPYQRDGAWYLSVKADPINTSMRPSGDCAGIAQCGHLVATSTWTFTPPSDADGNAVPAVTTTVTTVVASGTMELPIPLGDLDIATVTAVTANIAVRILDDYDVTFVDLSTNRVIEATAAVSLVLHGPDGISAPTCG